MEKKENRDTRTDLLRVLIVCSSVLGIAGFAFHDTAFFLVFSIACACLVGFIIAFLSRLIDWIHGYILRSGAADGKRRNRTYSLFTIQMERKHYRQQRIASRVIHHCAFTGTNWRTVWTASRWSEKAR